MRRSSMYLRRVVCGALILLSASAALVATSVHAQTPDEHAQHHPPGGSSTTTGAQPSTTGPPAGPGGMMEQMGEMMKGMGKPPPKELYPSLMSLPDLSPAQREQVSLQANKRMRDGIELIGQSFNALASQTENNDYAAMHNEMARLREGVAQFESGIAARRALAEGRAPREVALAWFKREMNLSVVPIPATNQPPWSTPFHFFTMVLLVAFALAMLAMYFFKMRRAAALFGRLDPGSGPSQPGESPTPGSGPGPASPGAPPAGQSPSGGGAPAPAAPTSPTTPAAGIRPASTPPSGEFAPSRSFEDATLPSPVAANWRGRLRVGSIITETPNVKTFRLQPSSNDRLLPFTFVPGQFLNVAFWIGGAKMNRSYSISSSPNRRDYLDLTIRREPRGAVSRHINDLLKVGDQIEAGGPVGRFTFDGTESDSIVLISGGVGITPMMSIARYLTERSWLGEIFFIHATRTPADFIFAAEIAALQRQNPKLHVVVTISRPDGTNWNGLRGRITKKLLVGAVPDLAVRRVHLCGPPSMMDAVKRALAELDFPSEQLKTEAFGAVKPTPAVAGTTATQTATATGPLVTFSKNNKSARIRMDLRQGDSPPKQSILELSEELGIGIQFSCRVGTCGLCKVKMTSGEVDMAVQDALDADDKANNVILACQAKPTRDVVVEA